MNSNSCNKTSCSEISLAMPSKAALSSSSIAISANSIESEIDYEIRGMEKPSDHAPVWTEFKI